MVLAAAFIVGLFHMMYGTAKQNLLNIWQNNVTQMAKSAAYYLARPADAVDITAVQVERMMDEGRTNEEIGDYLVQEMDIYASLVDNNHTGVYGYCRGEYLDASGWVPDEDYVPTERPWYIAARTAGDNLTFVQPYLNLQTHAMMTSASKLLKDGESVVSMDIFLDSLQKMVEDVVIDDSVTASIILDRSGIVVAHSDPWEIGKDYLTEGSD